MSQAILNAPPADLLEGASLFLDLDGTLVDLAERPDEIVADQPLRRLIAQLADSLGGRLAIVSGRSLAQLDAILGSIPHSVALSGSHGSEHRWQGVSAQPVRPPELDKAVVLLRAFADTRPGVLVEDKSYGVAAHYRMVPDMESEAQALMEKLADELGLVLQRGKMMVELRISGGGKGLAVNRLMDRPPMTGTRPIFVGDDITDESAFEAVTALGGAGVLVGAMRLTAARYRLPDPAAVRQWLEGAIS